ncbi:TonB-dependent receptor [Fluviispira multicolorata]|uniref:Uncharacterized protein n=1 Tax=Fluviispira multicolorata TaxID=2654512 RepID=A0A833JGQ1_9BACT|nr:TonB-dependent receptor [Fluviispira multicolorata]KAB8032176.1 hypothetical protein GCL57_05895 [Fluviispira multicolorata]
MDNSINYEVIKKSDNYFFIKANKVDEKSATVIFDCARDQYIYRILYKHGFSQSSLFYQREFKGRTFLNYNFKIDSNNSKVQSIQYIDTSSPNLYFKSARFEYDEGQFENNLQLNYTGDKSDSKFENNFYSGLFLGNGNDANGKYFTFQSGIGLYDYILSYQHRKYINEGVYSRRLSLNLPNPIRLYLTYERKTDGGEKYSAQRAFSFGINNFQSYHFLNAEKEYKKIDLNNSNQKATVEDSYILNNFSTYFFSSFIYQQINSDLFCIGSNTCKVDNLLTTFNFQNLTTRLQLKYNFIPHGVDLFLQKYFWNQSDILLGYSKKFDPIGFFQKSDVTKTNVSDSQFRFFSLMNLRQRFDSFYATLSVPLVYLNQDSSVRVTLDYEATQWVAYSSLLLKPTGDNNWGDLNWQFSTGISYYPTNSLNYAINYMKTHKIKGHVFSNLNIPEENVEVQLTSPSKEIRETKTDDKGYYEFIDVEKNGNFEIKIKKGAIESKSEILKETNDLEKKVELDIPYYTVVNLRFVLVENKKEENLQNIVNNVGGYSIISIPDAIYVGNKVILKRGKIENLKINPEILPFGYHILKMSENFVDTMEKENLNIVVYLKKEI